MGFGVTVTAMAHVRRQAIAGHALLGSARRKGGRENTPERSSLSDRHDEGLFAADSLRTIDSRRWVRTTRWSTAIDGRPQEEELPGVTMLQPEA